MAEPILVRIETPPPGVGADPVWAALKFHWRLLCALSAVTAIMAVALCFWLTPVYRATVLAAPSDVSGFQAALGGVGGLGGIASLAGLAAPGGFNAESARALLESRVVIGSIVKDLNLLPDLFRRKWNADSVTWTGDAPADIPTLDDGATVFIDSNLSIESDAVNGQIRLSVDWPDPVMAAKLANEIVARTNEILRRKAVSDANATLRLLNEQLVNTNVVEIRQAIFRLIEDQLKQSTVAQARTDYALTVLDPAVPPNSDDEHWPKKPFFLLTGAFIGLLLGCGIVLAGLIFRGDERH